MNSRPDLAAVYEYIEIHHVGKSASGKTDVYRVLNKRHGDLLGRIGWRGTWRQYVFAPCESTLYSAGCMNNIADFIKGLR